MCSKEAVLRHHHLNTSGSLVLLSKFHELTCLCPCPGNVLDKRDPEFQKDWEIVVISLMVLDGSGEGLKS